MHDLSSNPGRRFNDHHKALSYAYLHEVNESMDSYQYAIDYMEIRPNR